MAESSRRFTIGYALAPKKQESFIQPSLVNLAKEREIDLIKIDSETPLMEQGPFDFILQKFYSEDWKKQLADYKAKNPSVIILDSPEATERLHNRISMLQAVSEIDTTVSLTDNSTFGTPKQAVIYDAQGLFNRSSWEGLEFPLIGKPLVADGSDKAHNMTLVYNQDELEGLEPPIVLQEFVNHGGVLFKVYVAGDHVKCVKRKSLPDVAKDRLATMGGVMNFSQVSNLGGPSQQTDERYYKKMKLDEFPMPPESLLSHIGQGLRKALKLNLFNFDVIRDTSLGNRYLVVDINYFPGFSKIPNYEAVLTDFFCDLVDAKKAEELADMLISDI